METKQQTLLAVALLVLLGLGATLFALNEAHRTRVITTDSIVYIDTARHIASGQGIRTSILTPHDTELEPPQTQWPPLYSMLMAPFIAAGLDPIFSGRLVSAISFGLLVLIAGTWVWRTTGLLPALATATLLPTLPALTGTAASVWADSLYALIVLALASLGFRLLNRPSRLGWFVFGGLVGVGIFTKYLGIILVGVTVVLLAMEYLKRRNIRWSLRHALLALGGIALYVVPLIARNLLLDRPIGGARRYLSDQSLSTVLTDLWRTLSKDITSNWIWVSMLILSCVAVAVIFIKKSHKADESVRYQLLTITLLTALTYLLGLVVTRWLIDTDPIHTRFLVPAYPLVIIAMVLIITEAASLISRRAAPIVLVALTLWSIGWIVKAYDFRAGPFTIAETSRIAWIRQNTTNRDLLIGDHAPEYNLFLNRTVMRISSNQNDPPFTAQTLAIVKERWQGAFDRLLLTLTPNLDAPQYGQFVETISKKQYPSDSLELIHEEPKLVVYQVL